MSDKKIDIVDRFNQLICGMDESFSPHEKKHFYLNTIQKIEKFLKDYPNWDAVVVELLESKKCKSNIVVYEFWYLGLPQHIGNCSYELVKLLDLKSTTTWGMRSVSFKEIDPVNEQVSILFACPIKKLHTHHDGTEQGVTTAPASFPNPEKHVIQITTTPWLFIELVRELDVVELEGVKFAEKFNRSVIAGNTHFPKNIQEVISALTAIKDISFYHVKDEHAQPIYTVVCNYFRYYQIKPPAIHFSSSPLTV